MLSNEEMVSRLAKYLLQVNEGERLASVRQLAQANKTSIGTISNALSSIENSGAAKFERRGHMGTFVIGRSIGELWAMAEQEPMVISFPLIAHARLEGLATALKQQISETGIDVYLIFIRGSKTRMKALRENKCHIAVMSCFAAEQLCTAKEKIICEFPAETYVARHEVFYRPHRTNPEKPLRVAIDKDSLDVKGLTELEFADQEVEFKPVTFMQLPRLLRNDSVDAGIWSIDDMRVHLDDRIVHRPLSKRTSAVIDEKNTSAALVTATKSESAQAVIRSTLRIDTILKIQQKVMDGEIVPEY